MHFEVTILEIGGNHVFTVTNTINQLPLIFLVHEVLTETQKFRFWDLPKNRQGTEYVFSVCNRQNKK